MLTNPFIVQSIVLMLFSPTRSFYEETLFTTMALTLIFIVAFYVPLVLSGWQVVLLCCLTLRRRGDPTTFRVNFSRSFLVFPCRTHLMDDPGTRLIVTWLTTTRLIWQLMQVKVRLLFSLPESLLHRLSLTLVIMVPCYLLVSRSRLLMALGAVVTCLWYTVIQLLAAPSPYLLARWRHGKELLGTLPVLPVRECSMLVASVRHVLTLLIRPRARQARVLPTMGVSRSPKQPRR